MFYNKYYRNLSLEEVDKFHKVMRLNNIRKDDYIPVEYSKKTRLSQLIINDTFNLISFSSFFNE